MSRWGIKAGIILTPLRQLNNAAVVIENGTIAAIIPDQQLPAGGLEIIDVSQHMLTPGFVDIHHHGAMGARADDGTEAIRTISEYLPGTGTTSWLPTVSSLPGIEGIVQAQKESLPGAAIAGIHMEGPYLAPKRLPGEQVREIEVDIGQIDRFLASAGNLLRIVALSPELPGALHAIRHLDRNGVIPAAAHTKISYEQLMEAVNSGLRHVTHIYNVMSRFHHREPNMVGGALITDELTGELIADGFHVHPVAMEILVRCKGPDKVALITDSTTFAGLPDGNYGDVIKKDGIIRRSGFDSKVDHTMAGSPWPLDHDLRTLVSSTNVSIRDAVTMATLTPARIAGVDSRKGHITPGKDADLTVLDQQLNPVMTIVGGQVKFDKLPS